MKKLLLLVCIATMLLSCKKEETECKFIDNNGTTVHVFTSEDECVQYATQANNQAGTTPVMGCVNKPCHCECEKK